MIAVDPDFAGRGLGRQLTLAGLDYLSSKGLDEAMLYVDATNTPAVKLYVELGFTVNHIDRAYTGDIAPPGHLPLPDLNGFGCAAKEPLYGRLSRLT